MLSIALGVVGVAASYGFVAASLRRQLKLSSDTRLHGVQTDDGWKLTVAEYGAGNRGPVVFLQHGLAACHHAFDLHPHGPSFARWLADRGFWVFSGNLRGRSPGDGIHTGREPEWRFSDYLLRDVPAMLTFVSGRTGQPIHWVGHSLGGILGLAHAGYVTPTYLASITTLGSALHYGVGSSVFRQVNRLRPLLQHFRRLPWRTVQQCVIPLAYAKLLPGGMQYNSRNVSGPTAAAIAAHVFVDMTRAELLELGTTYEGEGIRCDEIGQRLPEMARTLPVPWLSVVGAADMQCPPDVAQWTFVRIGAPVKRLVLAGQANGYTADYGHFDLVCGRNAQQEIWPMIAEFIGSVGREPTKV